MAAMENGSICIIFIFLLSAVNGQICRKINDRVVYCSAQNTRELLSDTTTLTNEARNGWVVYAKDYSKNGILDKGELEPVTPWVQTLSYMESCFREINTNYFGDIFKGNLVNLIINDKGCLKQWIDQNDKGLDKLEKFELSMATSFPKFSDSFLSNNDVLTELNIINTGLIQLPPNIFSENMKIIKLERNKLTSLPDSWSRIIRSVQSIDLSGNKWICNCDMVNKVYPLSAVPGFRTLLCYYPEDIRGQQFSEIIMKKVCPEYFAPPTAAPKVTTPRPPKPPVIYTQPPKKTDEKEKPDDKYEEKPGDKDDNPNKNGETYPKDTEISTEKDETVKSAGGQVSLAYIGIGIGVGIGILLLVIIGVLVKFRRTLFGRGGQNSPSPQGNGNTKYSSVNQKQSPKQQTHLVYN